MPSLGCPCQNPLGYAGGSFIGALSFSNAMQFFQQHRLPGLWQFSIAVGDISDTKVNQTLAFAPGLPNGRGGFVSKSRGTTIPVRVTNVGPPLNLSSSYRPKSAL